MNKQNKQLVSMRLHPDMLERIDKASIITSTETRTAFVEKACDVYIRYIEESNEAE